MSLPLAVLNGIGQFFPPPRLKWGIFLTHILKPLYKLKYGELKPITYEGSVFFSNSGYQSDKQSDANTAVSLLGR